jgi:hypothetical protein
MPPHRVFVLQDINIAEHGGAGVGFLQGGEGAHERAFARAVGAEQAVHAGRDVERHILQGLHAVGIGFGEVADGKLHTKYNSRRMERIEQTSYEQDEARTFRA